MNFILETLSEMACDAFGWPEHPSDPTSALIAAGIEPAQVGSLLADLHNRTMPQPDEQWQSCDACWDPHKDRDPFGPPDDDDNDDN